MICFITLKYSCVCLLCTACCVPDLWITIILSIQRLHAIESRPNWMSVEMWVPSILPAGSPVAVHWEARRASSCTCQDLKVWQEQKVQSYSTLTCPHLRLSPALPLPPEELDKPMSISFSNTAQGNGAQNQRQGCQERRRRKANNRQEKRLYFLTWKQSLSTRKRSTSRTCCKCIFQKKKDKRSLSTLWNMSGEGSKLDLNKGCLTFKAGAADCCRVRWMRVTFQVG